MKHHFVLRSILSHQEYPIDQVRYRAENGELLEVVHTSPATLKKQVTKELLHQRLSRMTGPLASGVWRYKELLLPIQDQHIISKPEGNTNLYSVGAASDSGYAAIGTYAGVQELYLKHEGENPTGSFKDRGMTAGISQAMAMGASAVACASTGNTSAALSSYASQAGLKSFVFIPEGKIAFGKLSQSLAYGATTIQIKGDFDMAMKLVEDVCTEMDVYLVNSINPFRIEGQKTIAFELLQQLGWKSPDWIVLPAGNLGNTSAIGKGLEQLYELGFIQKLPRIASIQAAGANPFYTSFKQGFEHFAPVQAETLATAIRIGNPVSYLKAKHAIEVTNGVVEQVTDQEILDAKAVIDRAGIGCEPASATTIAGIQKLVQQGVIKAEETVAGILTGHILKDPETTVTYHTAQLEGFTSSQANQILVVEPTLQAVEKQIAAILAN